MKPGAYFITFENNIEDPRNTVLITGFQAEHTAGPKMVEGTAEVPIFGEMMRLRAEVVRLNELSGHADQRELLMWLEAAGAMASAVSSWCMPGVTCSSNRSLGPFEQRSTESQ